MNAQEYLGNVLARYRAPVGPTGPGEQVRQGLLPTISSWSGGQLAALKVSGSYAKGTAILGVTDVDLFVSLASNTGGTLKDLYESLATHLATKRFEVRRQNVSLGIKYLGLKVDLTPGRRQSPLTWNSDHSIYVRRLDSWMQTNVDKHVQVVSGSRLTDVMILMKRWRECHRLDFLSFAIELAVIRSLSGTYAHKLEDQLMAVFQFLDQNVRTCRLIDPANSNNDLMAELTAAEKISIQSAAKASVAATNWGSVVW